MEFEIREKIRKAYEAEGFYDVDENTDLRCDIYAIHDFMVDFTVIEMNVWSDIRSQKIPFLPQYEVGKYYPDFANPVLKIVVESDGQYHNTVEQKAKDSIRDQFFDSEGWTVFRIKGKDTFLDRYDFEDEFTGKVDWRNYLLTSSSGFFYALNWVLDKGDRTQEEHLNSLCIRALESRCVAGSVAQLNQCSAKPVRKALKQNALSLAMTGKGLRWKV